MRIYISVYRKTVKMPYMHIYVHLSVRKYVCKFKKISSVFMYVSTYICSLLHTSISYLEKYIKKHQMYLILLYHTMLPNRKEETVSRSFNVQTPIYLYQ